MDTQIDETWWAPAPIRKDPMTGRYAVNVWQRDTRFKAGRSLLCRLPLVGRLDESGVIATLVEYWSEYEWVWVGSRSAFFRRVFRPMVARLGGSNMMPYWLAS